MLYYRRNLIILSSTVFLASMSWNSVMPFIPLFLKQMGVSKAMLPYWIGIAFAAQSAASMLAQPIWGKLGDTHGRKPMVIRAGICLTAVYFGMSICHSPLQLVFLRFLNGALTGFIPGSYALIATNTPEQHAPRSLATAQSSASAGLIAGPALGGLLAGLLGYRGSMQVAGLAVLISTLLVWILVQEPNKTVPKEKTSLIEDFAIAFRSPIQLSLLVTAFLAWLFSQSISPYLALHMRDIQSSAVDWQVGLVFSLPAAAFLLTAHKWTDYGRRRGYARNVLIGLAGVGVMTMSLRFAGNIWLFAALYFTTGIWLAAISPSTSAITCTMVDETFRGRAYAIQMSVGTLGGMIGPLVSARVAAAYGISSVFVFVGGAFILGSLIFRRLVHRWPKSGQDT